MIENKLNKMYDKVESVFLQLEALKKDIEDLQANNRYEKVKSLPGIQGVFDGYNMIAEDGTKYKVPENYAVKSKIVYGDTLKLVKSDGKDLFKHLVKLPRIKVEAVVTKKEGSYYALTEFGDHKISNTAVDYNNIKVGDRIQVRLPEDNVKSPFATFDKIIQNEEIANNITNSKNNNKKLTNEQKNKSAKKHDISNINNNYSKANSNIESNNNNIASITQHRVEVQNKGNLDTQSNEITNDNNISTGTQKESVNYSNEQVNTINNTNNTNNTDEESNNYKPIDKDMNGYEDLV